MDKLRVFISGAVTGVEDYKERFEKAEAHLTNLGFDVMSPAVLPSWLEWDEAMDICKSMLGCCDVLYIIPNSSNSDGSKVEKMWAKDLGMIILDPDDV